jgi:hypothetical protein
MGEPWEGWLRPGKGFRRAFKGIPYMRRQNPQTAISAIA